ncbi:nuclear transport factor 2 family protein [Streptomyces sp. NPDC004629]|uniref:nuclear transport factor 2 family protein n=1 Tax=Streptomyces sp. NPDC004629 TaxID=3364705 RepID=UPI0036871315
MVATTGGAPIGSEPGQEALAARMACLDVLTEFFQLVDSGHASRALELFTEDAEMVVNGVAASGEALRAGLAARETDGIKRLHLPGEPSFRLVNSDEAETEILLQLFHLGPGQDKKPTARTLTHIKDRFVRDEQRVWRLAHRMVTVLAGDE